MDRPEIERRSAVLLVALSRQPRWLLGLVAAGLLAGVVFGPTAAAVPCLVVLAVALGWLNYLSWPALDSRARAFRLLALAALLAIGVQSVAT